VAGEQRPSEVGKSLTFYQPVAKFNHLKKPSFDETKRPHSAAGFNLSVPKRTRIIGKHMRKFSLLSERRTVFACLFMMQGISASFVTVKLTGVHV